MTISKKKLDFKKTIQTLHFLEKKVKICKLCPLHKSRKHAIFGEGSFKAKIMIIGESPGSLEDHLGKIFIGKAGKKLDYFLKKANLKRDKIFITNLVKCHPLRNRDPKIFEIQTCSKYLDMQIDLIKPKIIITLGRFASRYIFKKFNLSFSKIFKLHGKIFDVSINNRVIKLIPMYHVAYCLYNAKMTMILEKDFLKISSQLKAFII